MSTFSTGWSVAHKILVVGAIASLLAGCGSGLPEVVTSTDDQVSIEFENDDGVQSTAELASDECGEQNRKAQFKTIVAESEDTSVATYDCIQQ